MQMLALLWFELQFTSNISVKSFWRSKVTAKTRDSTSASSVEPNSLNRVRINCCVPVEPVQQKLVSPFDGIVTARNTDIGAYIPLGSGTQLFRIARLSPLRVYVDVPEPLIEFVKAGAEAGLTVGRVAGRKFVARVVGTARAIKPNGQKTVD
jgi:Barrel-sandwich domain of CusB or HlyD membrane-fusion